MKREINTRSINNTIKGRVPNLKSLAAIIVTVLFFGAVIFGQSTASMGSMDPASLSGMVTLEIPSANGGVSVILPDDICPGDTISGTVVFPANGLVEGEVVEVKTLEGEVVSTKNSDPGNKMLRFTVPQGASSLVLYISRGQHIKSAVLNINTKFSGNIPTQPGSGPITKNGAITAADYNFAPPRLGQTGRSISIPGNFDGSTANTGVTIGGRQLPVIAESPRKVIVQVPPETPAGPGQLTIREGNGNAQTSTFNAVSVELKADKLNLMRGEKTTLHISVAGLEGLTNNDGVRLNIENKSPQVVNLSFSREFRSMENTSAAPSMMRPVNTNGMGNITYTEKLTGVSPGGFVINALLFAPPPPKDKDKNKEKEKTIDPGSLKGRLKAIAKLKRDAANAVVGNSDAENELNRNALKLEKMVEGEKNWNDKDGTRNLGAFLKMLKEEKKLLDDKLNQVGADSPAAGPIIDAKKAIDEAIEIVEAEIEAAKKKKK